MRIIPLTGPVSADARGAVVAIGNFDGVHLGHRRVIEEARRAAAAFSGPPVGVLTFEPHPRRLFRPDDPPFRLSCPDSKARALAALGVDLVYVAIFDRAFSRIPAEAFIDDVLSGWLGARHVVVGADFAFGHRRAGDVALLRARAPAAGFGVTPAPQVTGPDGAVISSNTVRRALAAGDPAAAARLLGRPWEVEGEVVHGDARGRALGFPTANVDMGEHQRPACGIYAVRAGFEEDGAVRWYDGAASFGLRPQFAGTDLRLEVHLLDFAGDLYGRRLRVRFHAFLRGERKFESVDALVAQISRDVADCRAALAAVPAEG